MNIKQTLSYSLHEVARILDDEKLVEEELVPVFEDMIQVGLLCLLSDCSDGCGRTRRQYRWVLSNTLLSS